MEEQQVRIIEQKLVLESKIKNGGSWFYWIAGLSLINSIITLMNLNWNFIFGLGITQFVDGLLYDPADITLTTGKIIAVAVNLLITGIFLLFGMAAVKQKKTIYVLGMVLYALDGLLFLLVSDYFAIAFHVYALYSMWIGYKSIQELKNFNESYFRNVETVDSFEE